MLNCIVFSLGLLLIVPRVRQDVVLFNYWFSVYLCSMFFTFATFLIYVKGKTEGVIVWKSSSARLLGFASNRYLLLAGIVISLLFDSKVILTLGLFNPDSVLFP